MSANTLILLAFIGLKFFMQYWLLSPEYDLQRDEFLHLDQANHLAWGYLSIPPFTSWTSYLMQILGKDVFWIKFFPALYGALTVLTVWKATEALNGSLFAKILGATCVLLSALLRLNMLYQPNSFDVLAWTLVYFFLLKYGKTDNAKWLFWAAGAFSLGFLNKYNIIFQILGLLPALLLTRQRKIFVQKKFFYALVLGILIILPNIIWQIGNGFPVFKHLEELSATQLVHVSRSDFLVSQFLFFLGAFAVLFASFYALLFYQAFAPYRFFFWSLLFTLAIFIFFKAKDYYAIGIYPIYIAFGAVFLGEILKEGRKRYLQGVFLAIPLLLFIPIYEVAFPNNSPEYIVAHSEKHKKMGMLRWEDGKEHDLPQDFADMLGWRELAKKTDSVYENMPDKHKTLVLCDNYGQAGAINFYSRHGIKAVSFNADYLNWFDLTINYENVIRIKERGDVQEELAETSPLFQNAYLSDSVTNKFAREFGTVIFAFTGAKTDIRARLRSEIKEKGGN
jgi:hypothetical protein